MVTPIELNTDNVTAYFEQTTLPTLPPGSEVLRVDEVTENTFVNWVFAMHVQLGNTGKEDTVYVRQSRDHVKKYADLDRDPNRVSTEAKALAFVNRVTPGAVPQVLNLDEVNHVLVLSDIRKGGQLLADELTAGRVHEETGRQFGATIGKIQNASFGTSFGELLGDSSLVESVDPSAYLGPRTTPALQLFPEAAKRLLSDSAQSERSFVVGDLSPKNIFVEGEAARFLDLERTSTGDPAYDPAYVITHFLLDVKPALHGRSLQFIEDFMDSYVITISESLRPTQIGSLQNRILRFIGLSILHRTQGSHFVSYDGEDKELWQERAGILLNDTRSSSVSQCLKLLVDQY